MPTTRHALLIGVDFYFKPPQSESSPPRGGVTYKNLQGCVRDVSRIEEYLSNLEPKPIVTKLTASVGADGLTDQPLEPEEKWPTYENIKKEISTIIKVAKDGDIVYIHYSGHGILRKKVAKLKRKGGDGISGTALALTDVLLGHPYLTGYRLGVWVHQMILKKVRVVVILDSCHSGRAFRASDQQDKLFNLRTSESQPEDLIWLDSDKDAQKDAEDNEKLLQSASPSRNAAKTTMDWLSNPQGCTILTACQLDQQAGEYRFEGQDGYNGILTHWILDLVTNYTSLGPFSYEGLVRHVRSRTMSTGTEASQVAVLHGEGSVEFLGDRRIMHKSACHVELKDRLGMRGMRFRVDVGAAQGVACGATYDIHKASSNFQQGSICQIKIDEAFPLYSKATLIHKGADLNKHKQVKKGDLLVAVLNSWSLPPQLQDGVKQLEDGVKQLEEELATQPDQSPPSGSDAESPLSSFRVTTDHKSKTFRILSRQGEQWEPTPRVPFISLDDPDAKSKISYLLRHLTRFRALENHDYGPPNADPSAEPKVSTISSILRRFNVLHTSLGQGRDGDNPDRGYEFELEGCNKAADGAYEAKEGQKIKIRFKNNSKNDIHVAIFEFNGAWGVKRWYPASDEAQSTIQLAKGRQQIIKPQMEVPHNANEKDGLSVTDIARAYVYVGGNYPLSWDDICHPDIPHDGASVPKAAFVGQPEELESSKKSRHGNLSKFARTKIRPLKDGQWAALDLKIRTTRSNSSDGEGS